MTKTGRLGSILERAVEALHADQPNNERAVKAQPLRSVAIVAHTGALELMAKCSCLESAHAAALHGLAPEPDEA